MSSKIKVTRTVKGRETFLDSDCKHNKKHLLTLSPNIKYYYCSDCKEILVYANKKAGK